MGKIIAALCLLTALLTLVACTKTGTTTPTPIPSPTPESSSEESISSPSREPVTVEEILTPKEEITLLNEKQIAFTYTVLPENADDPSVSVSVEDETIARYEQGVLYALSAGQTKIILASNDGGCTKQVSLTVLPYTSVKELQAEEPSVQIDLGDSTYVKITVLPLEATDKTLTFSSSDPQVFTVNKEGKIKTVGLGTGVLSVGCADGVELTIEVSVVPHENHRMGPWEVAFEPTCAEVGMRIRYCEICGSEKYDYEAIEKTEHAYGEVEVLVPATREKNGSGKQTCGGCGDVKELVLRDTEGMRAEGKLGPDIEFALYEDGILYVRGSGQFYSWSTQRPNPLKGLTGIQKAVIGEGILLISDYSFEGCTELTSLQLPDSLQMIGTRAFYGCKSLTLAEERLPRDLQFVGGAAFAGCKSIRALTLGDAFVGCGQSAFEGCTGLTDLTLSKKIESLGSRAFAGCTALEKVTFLEGSALTELPSDLFLGCMSLKEIVLPDTIHTVGKEAFSGCTALERVVFGKALVFVNTDAFAGCTALKQAVYPESKDYFDTHVAIEEGNGVLEGCLVFGLDGQ